MVEVTDIYILYIVIFIFSVVQSIFGVGVLLFGTPTLVILGYSYVDTLWIVLPTSIVISLSQVIIDWNLIQSRKHVYKYTLPALVIGLLIIIINQDLFDISKIIGVGLLIVVLMRYSRGLATYLHNFINKSPSYYYLGTGLIHGLSNMGGGPLLILMSTLYRSKNTIRANIAYVYVLFGLTQLIVLAITKVHSPKLDYLVLPMVALASYFFVGKPLTKFINEHKYQSFITFIILIYGLLSLFDVGKYL